MNILERNWGERTYHEECYRERARIFVRNEVETNKRKKKRGLAGYVSYLAIGVIMLTFLYYFGSYLEISVSSMFDQGFIIALLVIFGLFVSVKPVLTWTPTGRLVTITLTKVEKLEKLGLVFQPYGRWLYEYTAS